jgi:hypothetical protein
MGAAMCHLPFRLGAPSPGRVHRWVIFSVVYLLARCLLAA